MELKHTVREAKHSKSDAIVPGAAAPGAAASRAVVAGADVPAAAALPARKPGAKSSPPLASGRPGLG